TGHANHVATVPAQSLHLCSTLQPRTLGAGVDAIGPHRHGARVANEALAQCLAVGFRKIHVTDGSKATHAALPAVGGIRRNAIEESVLASPGVVDDLTRNGDAARACFRVDAAHGVDADDSADAQTVQGPQVRAVVDAM